MRVPSTTSKVDIAQTCSNQSGACPVSGIAAAAPARQDIFQRKQPCEMRRLEQECGRLSLSKRYTSIPTRLLLAALAHVPGVRKTIYTGLALVPFPWRLPCICSLRTINRLTDQKTPHRDASKDTTSTRRNTRANMQQQLLLALATATLSSAHFVLLWPPTAGFDEDTLSNGPCGGAQVAVNDSSPSVQIDRFAISIQNTHPEGEWL